MRENNPRRTPGDRRDRRSEFKREPRAAAPAPVEEPVEIQPQVDEIEEKVLAAFAAETKEEQAEEEEPVQDVIEEEKDDYPEGDPFAGTLDATRRINLSELKFGRNYTGEED